MTDHTPGPWFFAGDDYSGFSVLASNGKGGEVDIADVYDADNLHIIAAAPDLLAACEAALDSFSGLVERSEARFKLNAAITKARGETVTA